MVRHTRLISNVQTLKPTNTVSGPDNSVAIVAHVGGYVMSTHVSTLAIIGANSACVPAQRAVTVRAQDSAAVADAGGNDASAVGSDANHASSAVRLPEGKIGMNETGIEVASTGTAAAS